MLCNWSYKWSWRARSNSTENESVFPLKSSRVTFKIHFAGKCLASFNSIHFVWQFLFAYFGLWYVNEITSSWTWLHVLPCLVNPKQGQCCRQSTADQLQRHLRCIWGDLGSLAPGWSEETASFAMLPLMEKPDPEVLPLLADFANLCLMVFVGGREFFYPCQMKLKVIWKQGTTRQLEFKILLLPKVLSPGTLLLVKKVGKQPGYFVNFQSISLIRGSTETSVNSWIKSILNFHLNIFLYIKCFPQIRKTWTQVY